MALLVRLRRAIVVLSSSLQLKDPPFSTISSSPSPFPLSNPYIASSSLFRPHSLTQSLSFRSSPLSSNRRPTHEELLQILTERFGRNPNLDEVFELLQELSVNVPYSFSGYALLGDAALRREVKERFMEKYGSEEAADIDSLVRDNVDDERLARACVDCELDNIIVYEDSEEETKLKEEIENFKTEAAQYPRNCKGVLNAPKIAANFIRSVLGAILLDINHDYDKMYQTFEKMCNPLLTKENPPLHPYAKLCMLHEGGEIVLKCAFKRTADGKNNVRVEINDVLYEDMTSEVDMELLKNRAAYSAMQKLGELL